MTWNRNYPLYEREEYETLSQMVWEKAQKCGARHSFGMVSSALPLFCASAAARIERNVTEQSPKYIFEALSNDLNQEDLLQYDSNIRSGRHPKSRTALTRFKKAFSV